MIGMGGGTIAHYIRAYHPEAHIDVVEYDSAVTISITQSYNSRTQAMDI